MSSNDFSFPLFDFEWYFFKCQSSEFFSPGGNADKHPSHGHGSMMLDLMSPVLIACLVRGCELRSSVCLYEKLSRPWSFKILSHSSGVRIG